MPFTKAQLEQLAGSERRVLNQVAKYLCHANYAGDDPQEVVEILADAGGCVPDSEIGGELWQAMRRKFAGVFWTVSCLLAQPLGCDVRELALLIDSDHQDSTRLDIIHQPRRQVLLTFSASRR